MSAQGLKNGAFLRHNTYRIEKVLGQGGFGITYLATDLTLDRLVAIKEFFPKDYCDRASDTSHITLGTSSSSEFVSRLKAKFLKEARNIAKFDHPGIIRIHAAFEENNTAYYVMDYIIGESLSDKVKRLGALSADDALRYIKEVAKALEYVHDKRINHLDIKPANIMVRESDDSPILIDFGLSKQYDSDGNQTSTTPTGISHGYAPLEQYNDGGVKEFSPQTDIYSLAATLYYLLTGITPPHATKLIDDSIKFPKNFPTSLFPVINTGMESVRKRRYGNIRTFITAIDNSTNYGVIDDECTEISVVPETNHQEQQDNNHVKDSRELSSRTKPNYLRIGVIAIIIISLLGIIVSLIGPKFIGNNEDISGFTSDTVVSEDPEVLVVEEGKTDHFVTWEVKDFPVMTALGKCSYSGKLDSDTLPHGHGVAVWLNGDGKKYDGEWVHGNMDGQTTYTQRSGDTFVGTFKDNRYHEGRYTIISSREYFEGTFKNGQPDKGNWYDKNGNKL